MEHNSWAGNSREDTELFFRECVLIDDVSRAYEAARREVFDLLHLDPLYLSSRQRQLLLDLEVAEYGLRQFRLQRRRQLRARADA